MTGLEAIKIIDRLLAQNQQEILKDIQVAIVLQVWEGKSYQTIARDLDYDADYIKQIGAQLWQRLSGIIGTKVTKSNLQAILKRYQMPFARIDWGEAIDVSHFYGREANLQTLRDWILESRCRVVGIFGWGGIGKTALSVKLAQQLESQFECVVWRSLRHAPAPQGWLNEILPILKDTEVQESSISLLMKRLRQKRCLLILDNVESILQAGNGNGKYLAGYEAYGEIFDRVADESHQSCMVITGREKPEGISLREGTHLPVRSLQLSGLSIAAAGNILSDKGVVAPLHHQATLINYLSGNPLALKLAATAIQNLFGGDIQAFLAQGHIVFGNLWALLDRQFKRLAALQQQVMYWLAINREGVTPAELQAKLLPPVTFPKLLTALETLRDCSLIESTTQGLTQQPVIMEYVTEQFLQQIEREVLSGKLHLLKTHATIEAQTKDYLRDAQIQLILHPLIDRLASHFTSQLHLEEHLGQILDTLRHQPPAKTGYAAGNLLNLFCYLKTNLQGFDFSHLAIRQAYLIDAVLQNVDFTGSQFSQAVFVETFGTILGIAFSPDGKYLATSDMKGDIQIWNARTIEQQICLSGHQQIVWAVDFSPDSRYLVSASEDYTVKLWDVATGNCLSTYRGHTRAVLAVTFSPDGQIIASASGDGTIRLWPVFPSELNSPIATLISHETSVWSIAFSPDGQTLVSGGEDCWLRLWDVTTGACLAGWQAHASVIFSVAFSPIRVATPGGYIDSIATASQDRTIKIWDIATQECLHTLRGHQQVVSTIDFSPDGRQLISGSFDRSVKLWDVSNGRCLKTFLGHSDQVWAVAFHPNGKLIASGGDDHSTKIWDVPMGICIHSIVGHNNAVLSLSASPARTATPEGDDCYLASGHEDRTIRVWDIKSGETIHTLKDHTNRIWSVKFSPNGRLLASGSGDQTAKLWDWRAEKCLQTFASHQSWLWMVVFSPDGKTLISSSYDQTIKLWDVATGDCIKTLAGHVYSIVFVACSPNGQLLASTGFDGTIKLWNLDADDDCRNLQEHKDSGIVYWSVAFNSNGQWLVSASSDHTVQLWSVATGECLQTFSGQQGSLLKPQFTPDDRFIISAGVDYSIQVWDIQTGKCVQALPGHSGLVYALEVARVQWRELEPPRLIAFSGSADATIKVWDLESGECLATWQCPRPYEGMKIDKIQGLTLAQMATLQALGAITGQ